MLSPYINIKIINVFLEQFAKEIPQDVHVVMVWDQAGFHTGNALQIPDNITLCKGRSKTVARGGAKT